MVATAGEFVGELAKNNRVIVIGGLAVIGHGFSCPTVYATLRATAIYLHGRYSNNSGFHICELGLMVTSEPRISSGI